MMGLPPQCTYSKGLVEFALDKKAHFLNSV